MMPHRLRVAGIVLVASALVAIPAQAGAGLDVDSSFGNWLLGVVTALVVVSIGALFRTVLVVRELVVEVKHLKDNQDSLRVKVEKHEGKHDEIRADVRRVEDQAREGRSRIYDHIARHLHTPVNGNPKVNQ